VLAVLGKVIFKGAEMQRPPLPDYSLMRLRALKLRKLANAANRKKTREELLQLANEFDQLAYKINDMQKRSQAVARVFRKER
jgi:hypothetical protein